MKFINSTLDSLDKCDSRYMDLLESSQNQMRKDMNKALDERIERMESKNPEFMALSHPLRMKYCGLIPLHLEFGSFSSANTAYKFLFSMSRDQVLLGNLLVDLIKEDADLQQTAIKHSQFADGCNLGGMDLSLFAHRFYATGQHYFKFTEALTTMLSHSDIGKKAPCNFIRTPYAMQYIEFRDPEVMVHNAVSGEHALEGMYINQIIEEADIFFKPRDKEDEDVEDISRHLIRSGYLTHDGGDVRVYEIMVTGSPLGKDHLTDDATFNFKFLVQDDAITVDEAINIHLDYYREMKKGYFDTQGNNLKEIQFTGFKERELKGYREGLNAVAKTLLYIISNDAQKRDIKDEDELKKRINRLSNKAKQRKLSRGLSTSANFTLIGSDHYDQLNTLSSGDRSVKMHWRRGHFRTQHFGEANSQTKVIWLQPMLINPGKQGPTTSTPYKVA